MKFPLNSSKHLVRSTLDIISTVIEQGIEQGSDHIQSDEIRIHNLRKRCKEVRALLLLIRPVNNHVYKGEFTWFKETAAQLSEQRDRHVFAESLAYLCDHQFISVKENQDARDILCSGDDTIQNSVKLLNNAVSRFSQAKDRFLQDKGKSRIVRDRFMKLFLLGQSLHSELNLNSLHKEFHAWRKLVKYHLFHCQLYGNFDPPYLTTRIQELKELGEILGVIQNMVVLRNTLIQEYSSHTFSGNIVIGCDAVISTEKKESLSRGSQLYSPESEERLSDIVKMVIPLSH